MTITEELKKSLKEVYTNWLNKYNIGDESVFYSDGEYDPSLFYVLERIVVEEDEENY